MNCTGRCEMPEGQNPLDSLHGPSGDDGDEGGVSRVPCSNSAWQGVVAGTSDVDVNETMRLEEFDEAPIGKNPNMLPPGTEIFEMSKVGKRVADRSLCARHIGNREGLPSQKACGDVVPTREIFCGDAGNATWTKNSIRLSSEVIGIGHVFDNLVRRHDVDRLIVKRPTFLNVCRNGLDTIPASNCHGLLVALESDQFCP